MPTLPGSQVVIDDCKDDGLYHGRHRPPGDPTGDWHPVTEEAPIDNQQYGRINGVWQPVAAGGKSVTEIVPAVATVGLSAALPAILYGTGFVTGDVVLWDGIAQPTVVVSPNELSFSIDTNLGVSPSAVTVTVAGATGAAGFVFLPPPAGVDFGIGLQHDETQTPPVVNLQVAGWYPQFLGGVYVPPVNESGLVIEPDGRLTAQASATDYGLGLSYDETAVPPLVNLTPAGTTQPLLGGVYVPTRDATQAADVDTSGGDGKLVVLTATNTLLGGMLEPPLDGMPYDRQWNETAQVWEWVPAGAGADFGIGLSKDDTATPPIVHLQPAGDSPDTLGGVYVVDRVRNVEEGLELGIDGRLRAPLATDSLAGTILEPPPDDKGYVRRRDLNGVSAWVPPADTVGPDFGTGLTEQPGADPGDPPIVHLQPAGDSPATLGGVYVIDRERNVEQGLQLDGDGRLQAPLATPRLAGTIVEPEDDGKGYVRTTTNGVSAWVPPADTPLPDFGTGLTLDETQDPQIVHLQPATDFSLGGIFEPVQDGMAYSRQFDAVGQVWKWTPALTAGLQITSIIPDKAIYGPTEPVLTVHAYGSEFTATTVVHVDDIPAATTYVSPTELTFLMNPAVPISDQFHIITVHDPAAIPPALVDGLGAEQFDFIKASTEVDYGTGLSLDTAPTPPIVHLDPAGPTNLGGVFVPLRSATQGLVIDMGDGTGADPATGELTAPLATPDLAGSIVEPPADAKGYVRTTQLNGTSQWVPPAPSEPVIVSDTPPVNPPPNALWWDSDAGKLYLWYDDGTTIQWVQVDGSGDASDPYHFVLGLSFDDVTRDVNLTPAGWDQTFLGGVWTAGGRTATEGLDLAATGTGQLSVPLATDLLAGSIVEPPPDGQKYVRERLSTGVSRWVHAAAHMDYGIGLYEWFDQAGERLNRVDLQRATADEIGGITEPPLSPTGVTYGRINAEWVALPPSATTVEAGIGLEKTGDIIDLQPPKPSPQPELGGVYGTPRSDRNAVVIDSNGHINVPVATDLLLGGILEPPPDDKQYARKRTLVGNSSWVEVSDSTGGINDVPREPVAEEYVRSYGRWLPVQKGGQVQPRKVNIGGDVMTGLLILSGDPVDELGAVPRRMLNDLKQYVDAQDTADRLWVETYYLDKAPPGGPYWMLDGAWSNIPAMAAVVDYGVGLTLDSTTTPNATVNLNVANTNGEIGGVMVVGRGPTQGLEFDAATGTIWSPLATDVLPGVLTEPPADQKGYVRASQADGSWQWVPPAPSPGGTTISDTPPPNPKHQDMWWESDSGDLFIYYDDGTSAQWVATSTSSDPTAIIFIGDDPPMTPLDKQLWWDSNAGTLNIWYTDVDTSQWVQVAAPQIPGVPEAPIDGVPYSRRDANWVATTSLAATPGDVKDGFQTNDHGGWIKLDGRLVSSLTSTQQAQAALLGFTANLPDATSAVGLMNGTVMGAVAGSMTKTIAVANLPAHTMTSSGHDAGAVTTSSHDFGPATTDSMLDEYIGNGPGKGNVASGGTGDDYWLANGTHSIHHNHRVDLPAHTHTVDMPNHTHTVALGGSGTPLDVTPKSISVNKFVFLGV